MPPFFLSTLHHDIDMVYNIGVLNSQEINEIQKYKDAVWAYLIEHSDITDRGAFFIKFHTKDRTTFEKHVLGRYGYGYHRIDERTNETYEQKQARAMTTKAAAHAEKEAKRAKWKADKDERRRIMEAVKRENERRARVERFIHSPARATARMTMILLKHLKLL